MQSILYNCVVCLCDNHTTLIPYMGCSIYSIIYIMKHEILWLKNDKSYANFYITVFPLPNMVPCQYFLNRNLIFIKYNNLTNLYSTSIGYMSVSSVL